MWSGGGVGVCRGGLEKSRLKLTSAKVEVEVEAELGNILANILGNTSRQFKKELNTLADISFT